MLTAIYVKALHIVGATEDVAAALDEALAMMDGTASCCGKRTRIR